MYSCDMELRGLIARVEYIAMAMASSQSGGTYRLRPCVTSGSEELTQVMVGTPILCARLMGIRRGCGLCFLLIEYWAKVMLPHQELQ